MGRRMLLAASAVALIAVLSKSCSNALAVRAAVSTRGSTKRGRGPAALRATWIDEQVGVALCDSYTHETNTAVTALIRLFTLPPVVGRVYRTVNCMREPGVFIHHEGTLLQLNRPTDTCSSATICGVALLSPAPFHANVWSFLCLAAASCCLKASRTVLRRLSARSQSS